MLRKFQQYVESGPNGILYTTCIDVFLIFTPVGFCYLIAFLATQRVVLGFVGVAFLALALISKTIAIPHVRRTHLELSNEQLDLLSRKEREFVSDSFRQIISGWRRDRLFP